MRKIIVTPPKQTKDFHEIPLAQIEQNENSRVIYKTSDLAELMDSMRRHGLLQPVGVRKLANGKYDAVYGNRRIMAAKKLGWKEIDAKVVGNAETDSDRDILNLIENFKRQNTSVAEDGRIFQKLLDGGLSSKEVSARLGITEQRVQTALDVFNEFPEEFKGVIVNKERGAARGKRTGKIGASMAFTINNIRKKQGLNRGQTRTLLKHAMQDGVNQAQLNSLAPLLKTGMRLQEALGVASRLETITVTFMVDKLHIEKLEKKHKKTIHEMFYELVESTPYLKATRATGPGGALSSSKRLDRENIKTENYARN
jgi:ParB/RepB/Spo0J family partition protein